MSSILFPVLRWLTLALAVLLVGPALAFFGAQTARADWRTASREPVGLAPDPAARQAVAELKAGKPPAASRQIFKIVRELIGT